MISGEDRITSFLLEEYKMLRMEIESYGNQKRQLEIYTISAILVIYGWIGSSANPGTLKNVALHAPIILVIFGIYRFYFYNKVIKKQVEYVTHIEQIFYSNPKKGWEAFWKDSGTIKTLRWGEYFFWFSLVALTIIVPVMV